MASPAELAQTAPVTLPADFGEWDGDALPATLPADSTAFDAAPDAVATSVRPAPAANPRTPVAPTPVTVWTWKTAPAAAPSASPAAVPSASSSAAPVAVAKTRSDDEALFRSLRSFGMEKDSRKRSIEAEDDSETESAKAAKRKMLLTGAGVGSVLLLGFLVGMIYHASHLDTEGAKQPARPDITVANLPKPSPETPLEPRPATQQTVQQTAQQTPQIDASLSATASTQTPRAPKVESAMMDDQLNAPTRIPTDLKSAPAKETPPSPGFGPAGLDGLGSNGSGVFGTVFGTQTKPRVKVEPTKVEKISAGVAVGLLTRKTAPIYPPIAKSAGVQGTVMLQAVISKSGTIENVHVVSGPAMLQQAAMDAVRTWRYKPYLLDNQPVEVETTVDVIFNLGR